MTMAQGVTEIERLIEQGLTLYGEGDLDGALLLWERVLVIDPENPQANSYVEYVRMNYELLTSDGNIEDSGPYGIDDDEPAYQIEIMPGEDVAPVAPAPSRTSARDEGWVIDEGGKGGRNEPLELELELEAEEPPSADPTFETAKTAENVSFEDATREYPAGAGRPAGVLLGDGHGPVEPSEFGFEITPGFGSPEDLQTPQGFGSQTTDVRRRELGFVQPTASEHRGEHRAAGPPELKMTLRTPVSQGISISKLMDDVHRAPTADGDDEATQGADNEATLGGNDGEATQGENVGGTTQGDNEGGTTQGENEGGTTQGDTYNEATQGGSDDKLTLDLTLPGAGPVSAHETVDLDLSNVSDPQAAIDLVGRADTRPVLADAAGEAVDLIATLPTPRPPVSPTKPLPVNTRPPAIEQRQAKQPTRAPSEAKTPAGGVGTAPTQELPPLMELEPLLAEHDPQSLSLTRDFSEKPTNELARGKPAGADSLVSAPTRELGLRSERRPATDDETTGQVDIHKLRRARSSGRPEVPPGMDPIDARSAEILEDIERNTPAIETRDERTRRRITALLDRATAWVRSSDLERAVIAADLALSEDPNSALAQKLIQRNLETFMTAFQAFLGDLQRTPVLARPLHELGSAPISPRAAFLLSRVDGTFSIDEILDVCGMPRLEAFRYLCQLFLRGILR